MWWWGVGCGGRWGGASCAWGGRRSSTRPAGPVREGAASHHAAAALHALICADLHAAGAPCTLMHQRDTLPPVAVRSQSLPHRAGHGQAPLVLPARAGAGPSGAERADHLRRPAGPTHQATLGRQLWLKRLPWGVIMLPIMSPVRSLLMACWLCCIACRRLRRQRRGRDVQDRTAARERVCPSLRKPGPPGPAGRRLSDSSRRAAKHERSATSMRHT
jgi:hypothetical protein